jgi:protein tyrosine phosphatase
VTLKSKPIELDGCIIRQLKVRYLPRPADEIDVVNGSGGGGSSSKLSSQSASNILNGCGEAFSEYEFTQFHLTQWPDHGVPDNIESIVSILGLVRKNMFENNRLANESLSRLSKSNGGKLKCQLPLNVDYLLVHCSAGCGRTGTIIAIDQLWNLIVENVNGIFWISKKKRIILNVCKNFLLK